MAMERLQIKLSNTWPRAQIVDLDTGQAIENITEISVTANAQRVPAVTMTIELVELVIETDETVKPRALVERLKTWRR